MEWIAYCSECGELERAPNGQMMESVARLHRRDTGHMTIIGYEPSIVTSGKMVEVPIGDEEHHYWEVTNMVSGEILGGGTPYRTIAEAVSEAQYEMETKHAHFRDEHLVIKVFDRGPVERIGVTYEPEYTESYWVSGAPKRTLETLERISQPLTPEPSRPFPQTIAEWADLGDDIKRKDSELSRTVNEKMSSIYYNIGDVDGAKRWLIERAGELGVK